MDLFFRELLISLRFNESGGQWSGGFLPDTLGDAQVKMRNYVTGAIDMVRVEIQNADMLAMNEETFGHSNDTSGTQLILLSHDDTGFMPYRIDNFSMEVNYWLEYWILFRSLEYKSMR